MMKRLYILIFLFAAAMVSRAQTYSVESLYGKQVNRLNVLYNLGIPNDTIAPPTAVAMYPHLAAKDSILYVWSPAGQRWRGIAGSSSGGGGSTYTFTAPLSNNAGVVSLTSVPWSLLSGKPTTLGGYGITDAVAYSDTALMLQGYVRKGTTGTGGDTLTFTQGLKQSGKTVVALNSAPMWNANRLQGYLVSPSQPLHGAFLKYDATAGMWVADTSGSSGIGGTGAVSSVFGRTGAVTALSSDYSSFYSPLSHTHNASTDITTGTLPIARGGTGLSAIGAVGQAIRVAADGTTLEYYTPAAGGTTYTAAYPSYINSGVIGIDTALMTTKGRVKAMIDSAKTTVPTLYTQSGTLSSNRRVTMNGYGLGLYNSATAYDTLNASYAEFVRNRAKVHVEDGWVMNHVESTGGNHWGRYSIYRPTSTDSVIGVTMFSRNNQTYNWKYSGFESDWSKYARMVVNVNWSRNNIDTSYKGIAVIPGAGTGQGAIQIDPEVLPDATGGEVSISYDPTTKQLRKGGGGGGSSSLAATNYATVYVDSAYGNNTTGASGRIDKPFQTIAAAIAALPATGGTVYIGLGSYTAPTVAQLNKDNLAFIGSGKPSPNWTPTQATLSFVTYGTATKLLGGTIIKGGMGFWDRSNIKVKNLGIDAGADYVSGGGTEGDGLIFVNSTHNESTNSPSPSYGLFPGIEVDNVVVLLKNAASTYHALLLQNCYQPRVNNVTTIYGVHGLAIKTTGGKYTNLEAYEHGYDGIIVKSNNYSVANKVLIDGFHIYNSGSGIIVQNKSAAQMQDITFLNGFITGGAKGVETVDDLGNGFAGVVLNNVRVRGASSIAFEDTTNYALIDCWADDTYRNIASSGTAASDVTAPTVTSIGTASATTVSVNFSESVTATTAGWSFKRNGAANAVSSVSGSGSSYTFTLADAMSAGETLLYSYAPASGATADAAGNELGAVTDGAVTNNISGGGGTTYHNSTFTATDGTAITAYTPETGNAWTNANGAFSIQGGQAQVSTFPSGNNAVVLTDIGQGSYTLTVKATTTTVTTDFLQIWFRATDYNNASLVHLGASGDAIIYDLVGGAATQVGSTVTYYRPQGTEVTYVLTVTPTTLTVTADGTTVFNNVTLPSTNTGTKAGFGSANTSTAGAVTINSFSATQ